MEFELPNPWKISRFIIKILLQLSNASFYLALPLLGTAGKDEKSSSSFSKSLASSGLVCGLRLEEAERTVSRPPPEFPDSGTNRFCCRNLWISSSELSAKEGGPPPEFLVSEPEVRDAEELETRERNLWGSSCATSSTG